MTTPGRILITGRYGFTGRWLAEEMAGAGWEVHGLGAAEAPGRDPHYRQVDLADARAVSEAVRAIRPDAVAHLAAISFVGHGAADAFYQVNLLGTRHLLAALADLPTAPRSVLLASSANVYGNRTEGVLDEETPPDPVNDYAVSKLAMEYLSRLWADCLPLIIVRPFNYTGVGQAGHFLLPKIVDHVRRRALVIELGNLDVWRDFSDVRAVVAAYRRLIEIAPEGTFNVCSGRPHALREVLEMVRQISGHDMQVTVNPAFVRANEVRTLQGDASRLRSVIGEWQTPPLEETLRWMIEAD
ncbi:MAG: GDP-mannose 4,6-dehydratase [Halothiobacillaceae bacterium]